MVKTVYISVDSPSFTQHTGKIRGTPTSNFVGEICWFLEYKWYVYYVDICHN